FEDVTPPEPPAPPAPDPSRPVTTTQPRSHGPRPSPYDVVGVAIAEPFEARPALPVAVAASLLRAAPLLLLALVPAGIAAWRRGIIAAGAAAGWGVAFLEREETWGLLLYVMLVPLLLLGALVALAYAALRHRRLQPEALAVVAAAVAFVAAITALKPYFPVEGGE
ncbi:MAG TPA: hypothetical protein VNX21_08755, partial [Candidatus Thermoplasmatota archaeon]|nr:hypothetical protein [Candidatus Thermoplasmatota archaeon]